MRGDGGRLTGASHQHPTPGAGGALSVRGGVLTATVTPITGSTKPM